MRRSVLELDVLYFGEKSLEFLNGALIAITMSCPHDKAVPLVSQFLWEVFAKELNVMILAQSGSLADRFVRLAVPSTRAFLALVVVNNFLNELTQSIKNGILNFGLFCFVFQNMVRAQVP